MKLKNTIIAGAISLAAMLGAQTSKAHETIKLPGEYKVIIGPNMSTWKAMELVLYGENMGSERPLLEQRKVSKALVGSYETTLWDHELPEIDKHQYKSKEWKEHMQRIVRLRSDKTGFGDIEFLTWVKRNKKLPKADGLTMELKLGDHFFMPERLIENKDLARTLDMLDDHEDHVIHAIELPLKVTPKVHEEKKAEKLQPAQASPAKEAGKLSIKATAGYLSEKLRGKTFLDGPKYEIDIDYSTGINSNWSLVVDSDNEYITGTFYDGNGKVSVLNAEASATFQYKLTGGNAKLSVGAGPKASVTDTSINYDGNKASINGFTIGPELAARLRADSITANAKYSHTIGTEGDSEQGYNALTRDKLSLEAKLHFKPADLIAIYEYTADKQRIRGVKRDNTDHKLEAGIEYGITDSISLTAACEKNWHSGNANSTTSTAYKGGVKATW